MNLLLDARKKIELALDQTGVHKAVEPQLTEALRLEELSVPASSREGIPPSAPKSPEGRASGSAPAVAHDDPRAAGKNLFAAKFAPTREGRRLGIIPIALISGALLAAGGGYYVWREITPPAQAQRPPPNPPPAPIVNAAPPPTPAPAPVAPTQESLPAAPQIPPNPPLPKGGAAGDAVSDMAAAPTPTLQKGGAAGGAVADMVAPPPSSLLKKATAAVEASAGLAATPPPPLEKGGRGRLAAQPKQETAPLAQHETAGEEALPAPPAPGIRIERSTQQANPVAPALLTAWQAYRDGDLNAAGQRYGEILKLDAKNRDALLGVAAIAQQQSRDDEAAHYYRQVLALDPRDPVAHAGMLSLLGPGNEVGAESRLKLLLAQQPQSPALHFALGNLYAEQSRWSDAQQAYFSASKLEPDNAQFAFNLAVSLDHLGKSGAAAQHYRRALQLDGAAKPSRIDRAQTQRRLNELMAAH
jgi:Flp pilus assembly protein TadD